MRTPCTLHTGYTMKCCRQLSATTSAGCVLQPKSSQAANVGGLWQGGPKRWWGVRWRGWGLWRGWGVRRGKRQGQVATSQAQIPHPGPLPAIAVPCRQAQVPQLWQVSRVLGD